MDLKSFVSETLLQLTEGVEEAQKKCFNHNALINPMLEVPRAKGKSFEYKGSYYPVSEIKFKVGLTQSSTDQDKSGIGVFLSAIAIGEQQANENSNQHITSIEFSVNAVLPYLRRNGEILNLEGVVH